MADTIPLTFRIDANLKRKLDAAAAADFRSTASLLNSIIARHLAGAAPALALVANCDPEPEPQVRYTKPKGRPRSNPDMTPGLPAFKQWLERREQNGGSVDEIPLDDYVTGREWHADATEQVKIAAARNMLTFAGYEPLIAHYPDGTEAEIWRFSA